MGKMKAWRREAARHNEEASAERGKPVRHQGRRNKAAPVKLPKHTTMSDKLKAMFRRVGLPVGVLQ